MKRWMHIAGKQCTLMGGMGGWIGCRTEGCADGRTEWMDS